MRLEPKLYIQDEDFSKRILSYNFQEDFFQPYSTLQIQLAAENITEHKTFLAKILPFSTSSFFLGTAQQLLGYVTSVSIENTGRFTINIVGYLHNLTVGHCVPMSIPKGKDLSTSIKKVLSTDWFGRNYGITKVIDNDNRQRLIQLGVDVVPEDVDANLSQYHIEARKTEAGQTVYDFLRELSRDTDRFIRPASSTNTISLVKPNYDQAHFYEFNKSFESSNVESSTVSRNYENTPLYLAAQGRAGSAVEKQQLTKIRNSLADHQAAKNPELLSILSRGTQNLFRLISFNSKKSKDQKSIEYRASRQWAKMLAPTLDYNIQLSDHCDDNGSIYVVNTTAKIQDEICGVNETLWLQSRQFSYDKQNGPSTYLTFERRHLL